MMEKAKEYIQPYARSLIKCVTQIEPGDDRFSHLEHYVYSNIWSDKFIAVDRYAVKKSFDGVIKKIFIHGHSAEAEKLQNHLDKYLSSKEWENDQQNDIRWHVLSLLLHLSYNPTGSTSMDPHVVQPAPMEKIDDFDWPAYLLENQPDFISLGSGSETEDECLSFDDELQGEYSTLTEDITAGRKELRGDGARGGGGPPEAVGSDDCKVGQAWAYIEGTSASAHEWLRESIHLPSVQGCRASSKWASANLAEFCDAMENMENELPTVLMSEYRVLREVLSALHVPPEPNSSSPHGRLLFMDQRGAYHPQGSIAIPSLTKGSLQSYLSWIGGYISMVREIEGFIAEMSSALRGNLSTREDEAIPQGGKGLPPLTYEAYASAQKEFLLSFKEKVLAVEEKVKRQDGVCTLLSVAQDLGPALKELMLVHRVHLSAICCWKESSNWLCSCRLLMVLYGALLSSHSDTGFSVCFQLFMKTFQPYLEIIHVWLTEGRLEDWREEFIIFKNELGCDNSENLWKEGFLLRPYEEELFKVRGVPAYGSSPPLGLLHLIRDKAFPLGKNMELLQHLDRLSEVQRSLPTFERNLHYELLHAFRAEMKDGILDSDAVESETEFRSPKVTVDCDQSTLLEESLLHGIFGSKDYYLKMAFGDVVSYLKGKVPNSLSLTSKEGLACGSVWSSRVPVKVEECLERLLEVRHGMSSAIVKTLLLEEFSLVSHLLVVRRVFLMEEGDCMHHFCTHLFQQAERGKEWMDALSLTNHLQECISTRCPDATSNFSVLTCLGTTDSPTCHSPGTASSGGTFHSLLEQADHIHITYAVQWPVNIVLTASSMKNYNTVFQFLFKVKWALWSLQQLRFRDLNPGRATPMEEEPSTGDSMPMSAKVHRLQLLRAWLLHFVGSVHANLMGQVIHVLSTKLEADLELACDLDSIIQVHESYLKLMYQQCLQTKNSEVIKMAITRVLDISMRLCALWKQPATITPLQLYDMESQYIRQHVFLAHMLENLTSHGYIDHRSPIRVAAPLLLPEAMRFSYTLLSWQRAVVPPAPALRFPMPTVLACYLDAQLWNSSERQLGAGSASIIHHLFLSDFYAMFEEGLLDTSRSIGVHRSAT